jgi:hypothetical protein
MKNTSKIYRKFLISLGALACLVSVSLQQEETALPEDVEQ